MVQALTLSKRSLSSPFFVQPSSLCSFTDRTISLFTIFLIKRMAVFTLCFHRIYSANSTGVSKSIFSYRYHPKVSDVDAMPVLTEVVNDHPLRNVANGYVISHPMRPTTSFPKIERAVTIFIEWAEPKMASVFRIIRRPLTIKSFQLLFCYSHMPIVPYAPLGNQGVNYV